MTVNFVRGITPILILLCILKSDRRGYKAITIWSQHLIIIAIDHSMYVSVLWCIPVASISVLNQHGAYWVRMCPAVRTQLTIPLTVCLPAYSAHVHCRLSIWVFFYTVGPHFVVLSSFAFSEVSSSQLPGKSSRMCLEQTLQFRFYQIKNCNFF